MKEKSHHEIGIYLDFVYELPKDELLEILDTQSFTDREYDVIEEAINDRSDFGKDDFRVLQKIIDYQEALKIPEEGPKELYLKTAIPNLPF